mmetsp:Transcript_32758/g.74830  ORF Transcript_32758/g.74830 Transcript_32758/m.74830 type:complete len:322 (-) Transcript_32758:265-1230(-)|eukprot:CAMPEP_0114552638 /NCGR_PEP_ID=MMETSP0114-20121206/7229_1 /TAXON_ID=31324 /ORGANISM="Goniomonas sp, Strain m" /LENGTH=321 /DNA_ID=CAMNT_0001737523 /DNA_START=31 /DNA_END=996 /DNA_ORIENTATION=-
MQSVLGALEAVAYHPVIATQLRGTGLNPVAAFGTLVVLCGTALIFLLRNKKAVSKPPAWDQAGVPNEKTSAPLIIPAAFDPTELLGCDPMGWSGLLRGLCPKLPVQLHCEPHNIRSTDGMPVFTRTVKMLSQFKQLDDLLAGTRARIKFRLSEKGKFVHRNRYQRRNIICCLSGEQWWLFVESHSGKADEMLGAKTNDNWNGYRSSTYPAALTLEQMRKIAADVPEGVTAFVTKIKAGDVMTFDGRWWHATAYEGPVFNLFFTPGKDMEVAVREHHRRMKMPKQQDLKMAVVNMAKCAKLSQDWQTSHDGSKLDWDKIETS